MNYPNIEALAQGCVSGRFSEWPRLKTEAAEILNQVRQLEVARDAAASEAKHWQTTFDKYVEAATKIGVVFSLHPDRGIEAECDRTRCRCGRKSEDCPGCEEVSMTQELLLRRMIWLRHGCPYGALYGDDGEMQCGMCHIDFKRDAAHAIEQRLFEEDLKRYIATYQQDREQQVERPK